MHIILVTSSHFVLTIIQKGVSATFIWWQCHCEYAFLVAMVTQNMKLYDEPYFVPTMVV